jgi:hypothetical protein
MDEERKAKRRERGQAKPAAEMNDKRFMALADKFISLANRENRTVNATDLHMAFLYAAARYNAHVAKNVLDVDEHEPFVTEMMKAYQEMLRNHLADPTL